jgi:hypothetical protein
MMDQVANVNERKFKSDHHKRLFESAEKRRNQIKAMRATGSTWTEIGKLFGLTPQRVQQLGK